MKENRRYQNIECPDCKWKYADYLHSCPICVGASMPKKGEVFTIEDLETVPKIKKKIKLIKQQPVQSKPKLIQETLF